MNIIRIQRSSFRGIVSAFCLIMIALTGGQAKALAQGSAPTAKKWRLDVAGDGPASVSLRAVDAPLEQIARELGRRLNIRISLSASMHQRRVTTKLNDATLEILLSELAPRVYMDFHYDNRRPEGPKILEVYLFGPDEESPPLDSSVKARSEAMMIEGDTEEDSSLSGISGNAQREITLQVTGEGSFLNVRAVRQPLSAVLYEIAQKIGVPFEMRRESQAVVDLDLKGSRVEEILRQLPQGVQFYQRVDLNSHQATPLRIVLTGPEDR